MNNLPNRRGNKPTTTPSNPHMQLDQQPNDPLIIEELMEWAFSLPHINREYSKISVPGAQAMCLPTDKVCDACNAFMSGTELAHFHPHPDYSMHISLPLADANLVIDKAWGELHPVVRTGWLPPYFIMLFAPRDTDEMEIAKKILLRSYEFATGN